MTEDETHEAYGALVHRGLVEQRVHEQECANAALVVVIERLEAELMLAKKEITELRYRVNYLERW